MTLLGIDIGTTHVKARAYGEDGALVGDARRRTPTEKAPSGGAQYGPDVIEEAVFEAVAEAVAQSVEQAGPPRAIGVASMGESGFLLDYRDEPLGPAIAWFDERTVAQAARWRKRLEPRELFSRTGLRAEHIFSACKLEWLKENEPEAFSRATGWVGMAEYAVLRMTGARVTDPSLACRTMLFDVSAGTWDDDLCEAAGIPAGLLPEVCESGTGPGRLTERAAERLSVPQGTPVVVCGHDHVCAAAGAGVSSPNDVLDSMGTAEASLLTVGEPPLGEDGFDLGLPVGCHVLPGRYYLMAGLPASGELVERLKGLLGGDEEALERWTEAASALSPGEGGFCLPPLHGDADDDATVLFSLGRSSGPGHMLRAVLEGLTIEMHSSLERAARVAGFEPSALTLVGGGAQSALWARLKANVSGLPVRVVSDPECTARGAAMLAGVGAGVYASIEEAPAPEGGAEIPPSGEQETYERLRSGAYRTMREKRTGRRGG